MKNIFIVSPYFYPEGGGLELYAFKLAEHFSEHNKVFVLCSTKKESKIENPNPNLEVNRERPDFFISNTPINLKLKNSIESIIKKHNIDVINAHTPVPFYADIACCAAEKNNIPFILNYHSSSLYKNSPLLDLIAFFYENLFEKKLFRISKKIILDSPYPLDRKLLKYKNKCTVIPTFVNTNLFKDLDSKKEKNILFVGQLNKSHKWKGLENLIKAFNLSDARNRNYKLLIIGNGDYIEYYKDLVLKLNLNKEITFLGRLNREEIIKYYQLCAFVVIPSLSNAEGTPTVLFESMACGKPIIGGDVGGIPYIVKENRCGLIVNAKNIKEVSDAMSNLIDNERLYKELSMNCLKNVKKYDEEEALRKHEAIFQDIIK